MTTTPTLVRSAATASSLPTAQLAPPVDFDPPKHTQLVLEAFKTHGNDVFAVAEALNIRVDGLQAWVTLNSSLLAHQHGIRLVESARGEDQGEVDVPDVAAEAPAAGMSPTGRRARRVRTPNAPGGPTAPDVHTAVAQTMLGNVDYAALELRTLIANAPHELLLSALFGRREDDVEHVGCEDFERWGAMCFKLYQAGTTVDMRITEALQLLELAYRMGALTGRKAIAGR